MSLGNIISPAMIVIIVILAIVVFISGLLHLLVRFIMKQRSSNFQSNDGILDSPGSNAFQRQLQHLFNLHDYGLDQAFIDALPVFLYKDLVGLNEEPYDCPVCLCELSKQDKLRLLPLCGHAFHIDCIDTWLLSNSTCPVCRDTLFVDGYSMENPCFEFDDSRIEEENVPKPCESENMITKNRVFSVRLGKFKNINEEGRGEDVELGETSNSNLDGRRCLSLGSCRYVVADSELQVALCPNSNSNSNTDKINISKNDKKNPSNGEEAEVEGKKINMGSRGESFSVSKVWQWSSKKGKFGNLREKHVSDFSYPFSGTILLPTTR